MVSLCSWQTETNRLSSREFQGLSRCFWVRQHHKECKKRIYWTNQVSYLVQETKSSPWRHSGQFIKSYIIFSPSGTRCKIIQNNSWHTATGGPKLSVLVWIWEWRASWVLFQHSQSHHPQLVPVPATPKEGRGSAEREKNNEVAQVPANVQLSLVNLMVPRPQRSQTALTNQRPHAGFALLLLPLKITLELITDLTILLCPFLQI